MPSLSAAREANAAFKPAYRPVAVFVGGTSGIGQGMAEALARHTGGNAHIVICGRDKVKAENIIESFPKSPESTYEFVQCDVSLMKNVQACTDSLVQRLPKINILVVSQGMLAMQGRTETEEGLDVKLALHLYSRWKFVEGLLPSLKKAKEDGELARVMTVLHAGQNGRIDLNNIDLKKGYSLKAAADTATTGNDIMVAVSVSFQIHIYSYSFINRHVIRRSMRIAIPISHSFIYSPVSSTPPSSPKVTPFLGPSFLRCPRSLLQNPK